MRSSESWRSEHCRPRSRHQVPHALRPRHPPKRQVDPRLPQQPLLLTPRNEPTAADRTVAPTAAQSGGTGEMALPPPRALVATATRARSCQMRSERAAELSAGAGSSSRGGGGGGQAPVRASPTPQPRRTACPTSPPAVAGGTLHVQQWISWARFYGAEIDALENVRVGEVRGRLEGVIATTGLSTAEQPPPGATAAEAASMPGAPHDNQGRESATDTAALWNNSASTRDVSYNPEHHDRMKHVQRRHFVRDMVESFEIELPYVLKSKFTSIPMTSAPRVERVETVAARPRQRSGCRRPGRPPTPAASARTRTPSACRCAFHVARSCACFPWSQTCLSESL